MIYAGTPLLASGVWSAEGIESLEKELYREVHLLPKDIPRSVVTNVAR